MKYVRDNHVYNDKYAYCHSAGWTVNLPVTNCYHTRRRLINNSRGYRLIAASIPAYTYTQQSIVPIGSNMKVKQPHIFEQ